MGNKEAGTPDLDADKNPFLIDVDLQGLLENLARNVPGGLPIQLVGFEPQRLQAMIEQADSVRFSAVMALQTVGRLSTDAAQVNKASVSVDWQDVGYLTRWLAEIVQVCTMLKSNARFTLEDPDQTKKIAMVQAGIHPDKPRTTN